MLVYYIVDLAYQLHFYDNEPTCNPLYCALRVGCQSAVPAILHKTYNVAFSPQSMHFLLCGVQFTYTLQLAA